MKRDDLIAFPFGRMKIGRKFYVSFVCFCFFTVLAWVVFDYANDLIDNYDAPVIASLLPLFLFHGEEVTFLKLARGAVRLPLIHKLSLQSRAPPAEF
jgi:hypothetical protein